VVRFSNVSTSKQPRDDRSSWSFEIDTIIFVFV
jgi:hypothetical protein